MALFSASKLGTLLKRILSAFQWWLQMAGLLVLILILCKYVSAATIIVSFFVIYFYGIEVKTMNANYKSVSLPVKACK